MMIHVPLCLRKLSPAAISLLVLLCNNISFVKSFQDSNSSSENSRDNSLNDDQNITLEDTFQSYIVINRFCDYATCKELYESADYPYEKIMNVVNITKRDYLVHTDTQFPAALVPRMGSLPSAYAPSLVETSIYSRPTTVGCKEVHYRLYPIKGKGIDGKDYYIINVKGFEQKTDIITCHKSGSVCGDMSTFPELYTYRCKQEIETVQLSTFPVGENITSSSQSFSTFQIPSGCSCERIRIKNNE